MTTTAVAAALLIASVLGGGRLAALLARPWLVRIGALSYAMYLWHPLLIDALDRVVGDVPGAGAVLFSLLLTLGAAAVSWRLIERRVAVVRRRWERRAPAPELALAA